MWRSAHISLDLYVLTDTVLCVSLSPRPSQGASGGDLKGDKVPLSPTNIYVSIYLYSPLKIERVKGELIMSRECCLNYPFYCDACDLEVWSQEEFCWTCPFDDAVSKVFVSGTEPLHSEVTDE